MAMLLRRVQDRVAGELRGKIQAIATSATMGDGRKDFAAVADFASNCSIRALPGTNMMRTARMWLGRKCCPSKPGRHLGIGNPEFYAELLAMAEKDAQCAC